MSWKLISGLQNEINNYGNIYIYIYIYIYKLEKKKHNKTH